MGWTCFVCTSAVDVLVITTGTMLSLIEGGDGDECGKGGDEVVALLVFGFVRLEAAVSVVPTPGPLFVSPLSISMLVWSTLIVVTCFFAVPALPFHRGFIGL